MKTFKDTTGQEWNLAITIGVLRRVQDETGVNLCALEEGRPPLIWTLDRSIHALVGVLWVIVREQAALRGIEREQFEERFDEKTLPAAQKAFWESLAGFFQRLRPADARVIRELHLSEQPQAAGEAPTPGPSSGNLPVSSASTPAA